MGYRANRVILHFDGSSRNNPHGPAGCGWIIYKMDSNGAVREEIASNSKYLGYHVSNNQAEYQGLIDGLRFIQDHIYCCRVYVRGDAEIVINQMNGHYAVRSDNIRPYYNKAMDVQEYLENNEHVQFTFRHVPRLCNWKADCMAREAAAL